LLAPREEVTALEDPRQPPRGKLISTRPLCEF
jgi:hypothetical protein